MTDTFQTSINQYPAPAVAGDFASANPRATMLAGEGALVACSAGVIVGNFAWALSGVATSYWQSSAQIGFIHRDAQALITTWLAGDSLVMPAGMAVSAFIAGDFWGKFVAGATIGQKVYANYADGSLLAAATASAPTAASVTASVGWSGTGSVTSNVLTVSALAGGTIYVGDIISGPGGSSDPIGANCTITAQLTGSAGSTGTYSVTTTTDSTSATVTGASTTMKVTAVGSGALTAGQPVSGSNITSGTAISAQLTGSAGSTGTYSLNKRMTAASTTVTALAGVETIFTVRSTAAAGELAKISSWG